MVKCGSLENFDMLKENIISSSPENNEDAPIINKELPVPVNKYLFLDLDMTLIDQSYQITDSAIFTKIRKLQGEGWQIGLNSNTPLEPLLVWMEYFGMKGPVIAEKGAVTYDGGNAMFDNRLAELMQGYREAIRRHLEIANIQWLSGNPVDIIRENKFDKLQPGPLVLLNTTRRCSLDFYIREVTSSGNITVNPQITMNIVGELRKTYPQIDDFDEDLNHERGAFLVMRRGQAKRMGTKFFMENRGLTQVGIIGDSMNDFLGEDIAVHYAVSNAKEDFKDRASFVSRFPMTKGCLDILARLAK